jgi:hypothetical protein
MRMAMAVLSEGRLRSAGGYRTSGVQGLHSRVGLDWGILGQLDRMEALKISSAVRGGQK